MLLSGFDSTSKREDLEHDIRFSSADGCSVSVALKIIFSFSDSKPVESRVVDDATGEAMRSTCPDINLLLMLLASFKVTSLLM